MTRHKRRDPLEVAIAALIALSILMLGPLVIGEPQARVRQPVKSLTELRPPASHWYADACGKGECE